MLCVSMRKFIVEYLTIIKCQNDLINYLQREMMVYLMWHIYNRCVFHVEYMNSRCIPMYVSVINCTTKLSHVFVVDESTLLLQ